MSVAQRPATRAARSWSRRLRGTVLGALCFFIGAVLLLPRRRAAGARPAGPAIVTKEV